MAPVTLVFFQSDKLGSGIHNPRSKLRNRAICPRKYCLLDNLRNSFNLLYNIEYSDEINSTTPAKPVATVHITCMMTGNRVRHPVTHRNNPHKNNQWELPE
jgi:hypothetical protein